MIAFETTRDSWDWLSIALGLAAAFAAVVAFVPWALAHRRRPEVRVFWGFSPDSAADLAPWPNAMPTLTVDKPVLVSVALRNVGDAVATDLCWNFVAPKTLRLSKPESNETPTSSNSGIAGAAPDTAVTYFLHRQDQLAPGDFTQQTYQLSFSNDPAPTDAQLRLLLEISEPKFNSTGRRVLPSIAAEDNEAPEAGMGPGTTWPPARQRRTIRWITAKPQGKLRCMQGSRSDVRDVLIRRP